MLPKVRGWRAGGEVLVDVIEHVDARYHNISGPLGLTVGLSDVDRFTSGIQPGLTVIAGRAGMGTTALALNIAKHAAVEHKLPVAIFSVVQSDNELMRRVIAATGGMECHRLRTGDMEDSDWPRLTAAVEVISEASIHFCSDMVEIGTLPLRAHALAGHCGKLGLIVVDDIHDFGDADEVVAALRSLAADLDVPVVATAKLGNALEQRPNKRPLLNDAIDAGISVRDVDALWFLYRHSVYNPDSPDAGTAEIIVAKQASGPIGPVRVNYDAPQLRFSDYDPASPFDDLPVKEVVAEKPHADLPHFDDLPVTAKKTTRKRTPAKKAADNVVNMKTPRTKKTPAKRVGIPF
jgi:replicative DNA helicase